MATGNEQKITITASSNLSEADIQRAVKEAEQHASEDKQRREEVETFNNADNIIYTCEKTIKDLDDKLEEADKQRLEAEIAELRKTREGGDPAEVAEGTKKLQELSYEVFGKVYQQAAPQQPPEDGGMPGGDQGAPEGTVEADYTVSDDQQ